MALDRVSFSVRAGEILCLAGVEGNGQREAVRCITGMERNYSGRIRLMGTDIKGKTIREIRRLGMAHIPEDRLRTGSDQSASIVDNIIAIANARDKAAWIIPYRKLLNTVKTLFSKYSIKARDPRQPMGSLSGGNMQKVIIAREFETHARLVVADQPTRGVDVGSTLFIHRKLIAMRDAGKAVLLVSADLSEVLGLADRILVFFNGTLTAHIRDVNGVSEEKLGRFILGLEKMPLQECA